MRDRYLALLLLLEDALELLVRLRDLPAVDVRESLLRLAHFLLRGVVAITAAAAAAERGAL